MKNAAVISLNFRVTRMGNASRVGKGTRIAPRAAKNASKELSRALSPATRTRVSSSPNGVASNFRLPRFALRSALFFICISFISSLYLGALQEICINVFMPPLILCWCLRTSKARRGRATIHKKLRAFQMKHTFASEQNCKCKNETSFLCYCFLLFLSSRGECLHTLLYVKRETSV